MSLSALAATVAPTNAAAAKNVIECFMVLTPRVHQLSGGQRPVQHQCSLQGPAPTGTEQPRALRFHPDARLLGPGLDHHRPALSFGPASLRCLTYLKH
jgi:hypothetical protein